MRSHTILVCSLQRVTYRRKTGGKKPVWSTIAIDIYSLTSSNNYNGARPPLSSVRATDERSPTYITQINFDIVGQFLGKLFSKEPSRREVQRELLLTAARSCYASSHLLHLLCGRFPGKDHHASAFLEADIYKARQFFVFGWAFWVLRVTLG